MSDNTPRKLTIEEIEEKEREIEKRDKAYAKVLNAPVEDQIEYMKKHGLIVDDVVEDE